MTQKGIMAAATVANTLRNVGAQSLQRSGPRKICEGRNMQNTVSIT